MSDPTAIVLHALAATTANEVSDVVDLGEDLLHNTVALKLAVYGTVTGALSALIETSPDETNWRTVYSAQVAGLGDAGDIALGELDRYLRATTTVDGTTSIVWSLAGDAHVVYCDPSDIEKYAIDGFVLEDFELEQIVTACIAVSDRADTYLDGSFELPLVSWSVYLREQCAHLVPAFLMRLKGCDETGADKKVFEAESLALAWFDEVKEGMEPPGIVDSTTDEHEGAAVIESEGTARGWGRC